MFEKIGDVVEKCFDGLCCRSDNFLGSIRNTSTVVLNLCYISYPFIEQDCQIYPQHTVVLIY